MSKIKLNYTPNKNEFILLFGLVIVVIVVLFVNVLVSPAWDNLSMTRQSYSNQKTQLENLKAEYKNIDKYLEKDAELTAQLNDLQKMIPAYYSQEEVISAVDTVATKSGLKVLSIAMNGVATESGQPFMDELEISATSNKEGGDSKSDSKSDESDSDSQKESDFIQSEHVTLTYSGTYEQLTSFLTSFEANPRQVYFRKAVLNRVENGTLTGSLEMLVFSSNSKAPVENDPNYPGYAYTTPKTMGKTNPFTAFASYNGAAGATGGQTAMSVPDFYVIINTYDDNANKILMGKYPVSNAQITSDKNDDISATLTIGVSGSSYQYQYKLGDASYSGSFPVSPTDTSLTLSILSSARKSSFDQVGLTLNVQNNTGKTFTIYVKNDDASNPRFHIGATAGTVQVVK